MKQLIEGRRDPGGYMNNRNAVRYGSELLPESLSKVVISWAENSSFESSVENFCSHGIRISIPSQSVPMAIPGKNDTIRVLIPIDSRQQVWFSGMCVYTTNEHNSHLSMGIYFYNPSEQNHLHNILYESINEQPKTHSFIPHEWEELVDKLCRSDDPKLKQKGIIELNNIKGQDISS
jgi:hypothetical protein